jgi:transcriptional regulator with XRE-family HTH domain
MDEQAALQNILRSRLEEARARNPSYSLRAFSKRLGVSAPTVSMLLSGKRRASKELITKFCERLMLDPQEQAEIIDPSPKRRKKRSDSFLQLRADQFEILSDRVYFTILNLIKTVDFKNDPEWIARRLGVGLSKVRQSLERLMRLEMIESDENGSIRRRSSKYRTSDDVANVAVRASHHESLDLAKESLDRDLIELRDFTWTTFAMDLSKLPEAKILARRFQDELLELVSENTSPTEVYRVAVQIFPLTRVRNQNQEKKEEKR